MITIIWHHLSFLHVFLMLPSDILPSLLFFLIFECSLVVIYNQGEFRVGLLQPILSWYVGFRHCRCSPHLWFVNSGSWAYCTVKISWAPTWWDCPDKNRFFKSWLAEWPGTGEYDHWVGKWYLLFIMVMKVELNWDLVDSVVMWMVVCFIWASGFQTLACISIIQCRCWVPPQSS